MGATTSRIEKAEAIAKKIRFLLQNQSLTAKEFANQIGITREHMNEIVDGRTLPTRHLLQKICMYFAVKPEFFGSAVNEIMFDDPGAASGGSAGSAQEFSEAEAALLAPGAPVPVDEEPDAPRRKRKFDLAELAAHHQALLECLIEAKVLTSDGYAKKVECVRKRAKLE